MRDENGITWERYQELHRDIRSAKRLSAESGERFDLFLTAYIKGRWTRDEIRFFATDYLELTRYHKDDAMEEWLRTYWQDWLGRLAHEDVKQAKNAAHAAAYSEAQCKNAKAKNREKSRAASPQK